MLMHDILASMAEFYSLKLAQEVLKGMTQKAAIGDTPTKAPLGYLAVRTPASTRSPPGSTTSPTPTPRPEQAWTSSPNSWSTSTTSTTSANQPPRLSKGRGTCTHAGSS